MFEVKDEQNNKVDVNAAARENSYLFRQSE